MDTKGKDTVHVPNPDELSGIRLLVLRRARDMHVTLADLSRGCGKNQAYFHQFIHKGSPRRLDEQTRFRAAAMLQVDESLLRDTPRLAFVPHPGEAPLSPPIGAARQVPLFRETDAIIPAQAQQWAPPFTPAGGPAAFAIWIDLPNQRLNTGDIAYAKSDIPARVGDLVVLLKPDHTVIAIGELTGQTAANVIVAAKAKPEAHRRSDVRVAKIVGILLP
jgi:hypothetical protein